MVRFRKASRLVTTVSQLQLPSSSPSAFRSSTRSHTALTAIRMGTPSNRPGRPYSQPQARTPTKTTSALIRLVRLVSQGVST